MIIKITFKSHIRTYELLVLGDDKVENPIPKALEDAIAFLKKQIRNWEGYSYSSQEVFSPNVPTELNVSQIEYLIKHEICILDSK